MEQERTMMKNKLNCAFIHFDHVQYQYILYRNTQ